jgi:hypothetical protein
LIFGGAADGANPILGDVGKGGAGSYAIIGIALFGVVNIAADQTDITIHVFLLVENEIRAA